MNEGPTIEAGYREGGVVQRARSFIARYRIIGPDGDDQQEAEEILLAFDELDRTLKGPSDERT